MKASLLSILGFLGAGIGCAMAENPTLAVIHAESAPSLIANFSLGPRNNAPAGRAGVWEGKWRGREEGGIGFGRT